MARCQRVLLDDQSARLKELTTRHRADVAALERALATGHGENLLLRLRLATYED